MSPCPTTNASEPYPTDLGTCKAEQKSLYVQGVDALLDEWKVSLPTHLKGKKVNRFSKRLPEPDKNDYSEWSNGKCENGHSRREAEWEASDLVLRKCGAGFLPLARSQMFQDLKESDVDFSILGRDPKKETVQDDKRIEKHKENPSEGSASHNQALSTALDGTQASQTKLGFQPTGFIALSRQPNAILIRRKPVVEPCQRTVVELKMDRHYIKLCSELNFNILGALLHLQNMPESPEARMFYSAQISHPDSELATHASQAKEDPLVDQVRLAGDQENWTLYGIHAFVIESQRQATADGCSVPPELQGMNIDSGDCPAEPEEQIKNYKDKLTNLWNGTVSTDIYGTVTGCNPSAGDLDDLIAARQSAPFDIMGYIAASHKRVSRAGTVSLTNTVQAEREGEKVSDVSDLLSNK